MTPTKKRRSGPTQTNAQRVAAGRVRLLLWLSPEASANLERLTAAGMTKTGAIEMALHQAAKGTKR